MKPGAYRIYDTQEQRYLTGAERMNFALNPDGDLMKAEITSAMFKQATVEPADPERYIAERWTSAYDRHKMPVYEGDWLMEWVVPTPRKGFVKYDADGAQYVIDDGSDFSLMYMFNAPELLVFATIHDSEDERNRAQNRAIL